MQRYFPRGKIIEVPATFHCDEAVYRVSSGTEMWEVGPTEVVKIQMAYGGTVAGRKAPSFPFERERKYGQTWGECSEFDAVALAVEAIVQPLRRWVLTWDRASLTNDISVMVDAAILDYLGTNDFDRPCCGVRVFEFSGARAADISEEIGKRILHFGAQPGFKLAVGRLADESGFS
jgi:hypothetical protein